MGWKTVENKVDRPCLPSGHILECVRETKDRYRQSRVRGGPRVVITQE